MGHSMKRKKKKAPASAKVATSTDRVVVEEKDEGKRELESLLQAFPSYSPAEVESAYRAASGDVNKAAEILGGISDGGDVREAPPELEVLQKKKQTVVESVKCRKQKKVAASTGTVSSMIGKGYMKYNSANGSAKSKELSKYSIRNEDAEDLLCSMLGDDCALHMGVIRDVLCHCGYDIEKALDALLELSVPSHDQFKDGECGSSSSSSGEVPEEYGNDLVQGIIRKCQLADKVSNTTLGMSGKQLHQVVESAGYVCRDDSKFLFSSEKNPSLLSEMKKSDIQLKVLQSLYSLPDISEHKPNSMDWKKVVKKMEPFGQGWQLRSSGVAETHQNFGHTEGDDYQVIRRPASQHWDTMKSYYQKAAVAYARGERGNAAYYSDQGKLFNRKAREADDKASQEIFEARNKNINNSITIDLHGQHVKEAIKLLKAHLMLLACVPSIQILTVITGCGTHGVGKGKLKQSVINLVEKEGIEWSEGNKGTVVIRLDGPKKFSFLNSDDDDSDSE